MKAGKGRVGNSSDIEEMEMEGGARIRWLITHRDGAPNFSMRLISIPEGKNTPFHSHNYEHEIFIIEGKVKATIDDDEKEAKNGDYVFIPPNAYHGMVAEMDTRLICIVPVDVARQMLGN